MTPLIVAGIGLLGGLGALARFLVARFPSGTLVVNLSGSLLLGVLVGAGVDGDASRLAATGFVGAYTTFSTWMLESRGRNAWLNVGVSLVLGLAAAWLGRAIGRAL